MAKEERSQDAGGSKLECRRPDGAGRGDGVIPNPKAKLLDQVREVMRPINSCRFQPTDDDLRFLDNL